MHIKSAFLHFFLKKICIYQKNVVPLHSLLLNGVMVALQILVLSVWVRVLVEQLEERGHKQQVTSFFLLIPTRTQVLRHCVLSIIAVQFSSPG